MLDVAGDQVLAPTKTTPGRPQGPAAGKAFGPDPPQHSSDLFEDGDRRTRRPSGRGSRGPFVKGLILAQNERWRRGLGMQVERAQQCVSGGRVSKATATNPGDGYSRGKLRVMPSDARASASTLRQMDSSALGRAVVVLGRWRGSGPPSLRCLPGVRARPGTLGLRHCPDSYGRLQSRILGNARKRDPAMPRV